MIRIFVTGGTFDKTYDEISGRLSFGDTHLPEMLRLGRSRVEMTVETLMMIDSLDMTDADRALIVAQLRRSARSRASSSRTAPTRWSRRRGRWPSGVTRQDGRPDRRDDSVRVRQLGRAVQPRQRAVIRAGAAAGRLHRDERTALSVGQGAEEPRDGRLRSAL